MENLLWKTLLHWTWCNSSLEIAFLDVYLVNEVSHSLVSHSFMFKVFLNWFLGSIGPKIISLDVKFTEYVVQFCYLHPLIWYIGGQHLDERLRITSGGRNCWTITLQDDMTYNLQNRQNRNTYEYLTLQITFYPTSGSTRYYSSTLFIVDNERGKKYVIFIYQFCVSIMGV